MGELYAFRHGRYKVHFITEGRYGLPPSRVEHDPPLLFDLGADVGEQYDIATAEPEALARIVTAAEQYHAEMTLGPPLFDRRETTP